MEKGGQIVLPGAEASTRQALDKRAADPMRGKKPQKDMSAFDLFDPDGRKQSSLFSLREPVAKVDSSEIAAPGTPNRRKVIENWAVANLKGDSIQSQALGVEVKINRRGINKVMSHAGDDLLAIVPSIPDIIRNGVLVGEPTKPRHPDDLTTKAFHTIGAIVEVDGVRRAFLAHIREALNGNFFYDVGTSDAGQWKEGERARLNLTLKQPASPEQDVSTGSSDGNYSLRDDERIPGIPGFYSPVARAVLDLKQARGTGEQMLAMIGRTAGVKPEEMRWLGLDSWLHGQKSVTREQVMDYVRANSLDVRDVVKGGADDPLTARERRDFHVLSDLEEDGPSMSDAAQARLAEYHRRVAEASPEGDPKYRDYTTPGGSS